MKTLVWKSLLLAVPFLVILTCYAITDPSKKIWNYDSYLFDYTMLNRGDVSTRLFLKNRAKYQYDSFILGSSRSLAYTSRTWAKYLPAGSSCFSYGSWNEPIAGIYGKLRLIDSLGGAIRHALLIIDVDRTFATGSDLMMNDHYLVSGASRFDYYYRDFTRYLRHPKLMLASVDYTIFHKRRGYMDDFVGMQPGDVDPVTNDWRPNSEVEIDSNPTAYYAECQDRFYARPGRRVFAARQIDREKEVCLKNIHDLFSKHHTDYEIVIGPLYNQIEFAPEDIRLLRTLFGTDRVHDYSGINALTADYHNFYSDVDHYRKTVGNAILRDIYGVRAYGATPVGIRSSNGPTAPAGSLGSPH